MASITGKLMSDAAGTDGGGWEIIQQEDSSGMSVSPEHLIIAFLNIAVQGVP